ILAHHGGAGAAVFHVDRDPLAKQDLVEVRFVGAIGALGPGTGIGVLVEHARHALLRQDPQVLDIGDHGHGCSPLLFANASGSRPPGFEESWAALQICSWRRPDPRKSRHSRGLPSSDPSRSVGSGNTMVDPRSPATWV